MSFCIDIVLHCHYTEDAKYIKGGCVMAVLQVRIDDELKNQASVIFNGLGIDLSTAIRMFLKKAVLERGIPFDTKFDETTLQGILAIERMRTISEQNGNCNMTLDEINEEIKQAREEIKRKKGDYCSITLL